MSTERFDARSTAAVLSLLLLLRRLLSTHEHRSAQCLLAHDRSLSCASFFHVVFTGRLRLVPTGTFNHVPSLIR